MRNIGQRLARIELGRHAEELIVVNPRSFEDEPLTAEALELHRLEVLRIARNPRGILITFMDEGDSGDPLRELLGDKDYATIQRHATTTIKRSYGLP